MESYEIVDIQKYNENQAKGFVELVTTISRDEWFDILAKAHSEKTVYAADIPQFSNFDVGTIQVVSLIRQLGDYGPTYEKIGRDLLGKGRNKVAYLKYGENHSKLAEQCGLLKVILEGRKKTVFLTEVGKCFDALDEKGIHDQPLRFAPQQNLYFLPDPQGQGSLLPTFAVRLGVCTTRFCAPFEPSKPSFRGFATCTRTTSSRG